MDLFINKLNRQISSDYYLTLDMTRLNIWLFAIKSILQRPFLGWGSASFPTILSMDLDTWKGHAHNLFLEIGVSYGLPVLVLISCFIFFILYRNYKNILQDNKFRNRFTKTTLFKNAWFFSTITLMISQLFDVQYFDGRISIVFWILLAGLKNNILVKKVNNKLELN